MLTINLTRRDLATVRLIRLFLGLMLALSATWHAAADAAPSDTVTYANREIVTLRTTAQGVDAHTRVSRIEGRLRRLSDDDLASPLSVNEVKLEGVSRHFSSCFRAILIPMAMPRSIRSPSA